MINTINTAVARRRAELQNGENDKGFTLIELMVVIIIIGILAAIAIPVFLNQRKKAVDASMKSDLRTLANEEETYFTDNQKYLAIAATSSPSLNGNSVTLSNGNSVTVTLNTAGSAFCVAASRVSGAQPGSQTSWVYVSSKGGIQAFTHSLALEYAKDGLRAACVAPGSIKSGITDATGGYIPKDADWSLFSRLMPVLPTTAESSGAGMAEPNAVAGVIAMLVSDDGAWITGTEIRMDGGTHA